MLVAVISPHRMEVVNGGSIRLHHVLLSIQSAVDVVYLTFARWYPEPFTHDGVPVLPIVTGRPRRRLPPRLDWWWRSRARRRSLTWQQFDGLDLSAWAATEYGAALPDVVHVTSASLYAGLPQAWRRTAGVIEHHDVLSRRELSFSDAGGSYTTREFGKILRDERAAVLAAQMNFTVSPDESAWLQEHHPGVAVTCAPNGVDTARCLPQREQAGPRELLFVGYLRYQPNSEGLDFFIGSVLPRVAQSCPDVHLTVVGAGADEYLARGAALDVSRVRFAGAVDDVLPYYNRAALAVVPLLGGGGSRLKVVEACAMECPLVATSLGAGGYGLEHEEHLLYADDAAAFAEAVVRTLNEPERARLMAARARAYVLPRYDWRETLRPLREWYQSAAQRSGLHGER